MWKDTYQREEYMQSFDVPDGEHNLIIKSAKEEVSNSGKRMIKIGYSVSESNGAIFYDYIVEGEFFNRKMTIIFDVFKIPAGDWDYNGWIGKAGRAKFSHRPEEYTASDGTVRKVNRAKLDYYIGAQKGTAQAAAQPARQPWPSGTGYAPKPAAYTRQQPRQSVSTPDAGQQYAGTEYDFNDVPF